MTYGRDHGQAGASVTIKGILFDKDGTLFDFGTTWNGWAAQVIADLAGGDGALAEGLAGVLRFDPVARRFHPDSPVIAGTNREVAELIATVLTGWRLAALEERLTRHAAAAALAPAVALGPFLRGLAGQGLRLGVMTNDAEAAARAHLAAAEVAGLFDFIAGFDSGFGAKPAPGPLLAFADAMGLAPETVVMVGDSTHDLQAGRAAGMRTVGVLTGMADRATLAPLADTVLPDIGHLPGWIMAQG